MRRLFALVTIGFFSLPAFTQEQSPKQAAELIRTTADKALNDNSTLAADIHSLIVYKNSTRLYEQYWNGFTADSLNNLKSITKSIVGLLVGIALDQGHIKSLEQPVLDFFSGCPLHEKIVEAKRAITIEHLLLMKAGISWNNRARIKDDWWYHENPHCFLLNEFPMDTLPGLKFSYNSAVAHLLSGIISRSTGKSTLAFARQHLFTPLGIEEIGWSKDRAGEYYGNSELSLKPEDLIKIGQMLLNRGSFNGRRVVPETWIKQMTEKAHDATSLMNYGYLWMTSKEESPYFYFAGGSGGQHLFIVPEKSLVVVTTGHWDNARSTVEIMRLAVKVINQL